MTDNEFRKMLMDPFGSTAWKVLDTATKQKKEFISNNSILKTVESELGSVANFIPVYLAEKSLKLYNTNFNLIDKNTLEQFEIALKKDSQSRSHI